MFRKKISSILIIGLLGVTSINADNVVDDEKYLDSVTATAEYISAKAHFKSQDFSVAFLMFDKLFQHYNNHPLVNYYLALSAIELAKYNEATAAFERVLIMAPDFHRARLEFATLQYKMGFKSVAKEEFEKVLTSSAPEAVKENIRHFIRMIQDDDKKTFGFGSFMVGYLVTDNANNGLEDVEYKLPGLFNLTVSGEKERSNGAHVEQLNLNFINKLEHHEAFNIQNSFTLYNRDYKDEKEANLRFLSYQPTLSYYNIENKSRYSLSLSVDIFDVGQNNIDEFKAYAFIPSYTKVISNKSSISAYGKYQTIRYDKEQSEDREYDRYECGAEYLYDKFYTRVTIAKDVRVRDVRSDISKNNAQFALGYNFMLLNDLLLNAEYKLQYTKYKEQDMLFDSKREDYNHYTGLRLSKIFTKQDIVNIDYSYIRNSSNQEAFDYEKNIGMISYIRKFQW